MSGGGQRALREAEKALKRAYAAGHEAWKHSPVMHAGTLRTMPHDLLLAYAGSLHATVDYDVCSCASTCVLPPSLPPSLPLSLCVWVCLKLCAWLHPCICARGMHVCVCLFVCICACMCTCVLVAG